MPPPNRHSIEVPPSQTVGEVIASSLSSSIDMFKPMLEIRFAWSKEGPHTSKTYPELPSAMFYLRCILGMLFGLYLSRIPNLPIHMGMTSTFLVVFQIPSLFITRFLKIDVGEGYNGGKGAALDGLFAGLGMFLIFWILGYSYRFGDEILRAVGAAGGAAAVKAAAAKVVSEAMEMDTSEEIVVDLDAANLEETQVEF
ncbi:hypothetical protein ScalyP_jg1847 [Parmales sp. scaly parma]|nr:hypothetical protein ScalyP_jg1847 [Parmales sp. scaly parma]